MGKSLYALVGMKHRGTEALVASLPQGEPLTLIREPTNPYDHNAVQVWAREQHIGFVKSTQVRPLAMAMDRAIEMQRLSRGGGGVMPAKLSIDGGHWPMVEVDG